MANADDYNRMIGDGKPGSLVAETEKAIKEINSYAPSPEQERLAEEAAVRWGAILQGRQVVGTHGVVLPMALAQDIYKALRGLETNLGPDLLGRMLDRTIRDADENAGI